MINYNKGKIYKIEPICEHDDHEIYIGLTTKDKLCQRMATHRNDYKKWLKGKASKLTSYDLFNKYGLENCRIVLIESVNASTKDELLARESYYIKELPCVNKCISHKSEEEIKNSRKDYYQKNKEIKLKRDKKRYENNKEQILVKNKLYYEENKETILQRNRDAYHKNKSLNLEKRKNQISCCDYGSEFRSDTKARHEGTEKHKQYICSLSNFST